MLKYIAKFLAIGAIRFYQIGISPYFPSSCRHTPTCSGYMLEAIQEWGVFKGIVLGLKRLSKCHPYGTYGYDPVPKKAKDE
nr:membrane protein insertion efficiency factor YidD [Reichenbachiella versicolor]